MKNAYIKRIILIFSIISMFAMLLSGCGQEDGTSEDGTNQNTEAASTGSDNQDYQDYIHDALEAVRDSATVDTGNNSVKTPDNDVEGDGNVIYVEKEDPSQAPESVYVSSTEIDDQFEKPEETTSVAPADSSSSSEEKKVTPATFDVGTGLVYIDGKYDTTYQNNLLTLINDARTGLNYPAMTINESLGICANLRSKEITCFLSHMRPDGSMFYSLAPEYYKAEIITIDGASEKETFNAWLTDPVSRNIIFSKEYTNMNAANYVCNGLNCIVVSFGY